MKCDPDLSFTSNCNGFTADFYAAIRGEIGPAGPPLANRCIFVTTSQTVTFPQDVEWVYVILWGGGAGGGFSQPPGGISGITNNPSSIAGIYADGAYGIKGGGSGGRIATIEDGVVKSGRKTAAIFGEYGLTFTPGQDGEAWSASAARMGGACFGMPGYGNNPAEPKSGSGGACNPAATAGGSGGGGEIVRGFLQINRDYPFEVKIAAGGVASTGGTAGGSGGCKLFFQTSEKPS